MIYAVGKDFSSGWLVHGEEGIIGPRSWDRAMSTLESLKDLAEHTYGSPAQGWVSAPRQGMDWVMPPGWDVPAELRPAGLTGGESQ